MRLAFRRSRLARLIAPLTVWLGVMVCALGLAQDSKPLIAVVPEDFPPTYFRDPATGKPAGLAIDVTNEIVRLAGLKVNYRFAKAWDEIERLLSSGQADIIPFRVMNEKTLQQFLFTSPLDINAVNYVVRADRTDWKQPTAGMKVGVIKGSTAQEYLKNRTDITLELFENLEPLFIKLLTGQIDIVLTSTPNLRRLAEDAGLDDRIRVVEPPVLDAKRGLAVRLDNETLRDRLNAAIEQFDTLPQTKSIYEKWLGKPKSWWTVQRVTLTLGSAATGAVALLLVLRVVGMRRMNRRLRAERAFVQAIIDGMPDFVFYKDLNGVYLGCNEAFASVWMGLEKNDILGRTDNELLPDRRQAATLNRHDQEVLTTRSATTREGLFTLADGRTVELETIRVPFTDEHGVCAGLIGVARDVTLRKHIDETIRESETKFQTIFENSPYAIAIQQLGTEVYLDVNSAFVRHAGLTSKADIVGKTSSDVAHVLINPEERLLMQAEFRATGRVNNFAFSSRRTDGSIAHNLVSAFPVVINREDCVVSLVLDITEFEQAKEAQRASEAKYRELVENANSIILRVSREGRVTFFNEYAQKFFGFREDEILGRSVIGTIVPERESTGRDLITMIEDLMVNPDHYTSNENENMRRNGERVWVSWTNRPVVDDEGRVRELLCIGSDVTVRKRAEAELEERVSRIAAEQDAVATLAVSAAVGDGNVEMAVQALTETVARVLAVERAGVWLFDATETTLENIDLYELSLNRHTSGAVISDHEFHDEFQILRTQKYVNADDPLTDPRTKGYVEGYLKPRRITSMLDGMIRAGGRNLGVLCFEHVDTPHHWTADEIAFCCQAADQIAIAILNRERRQVEEERQRYQDQLVQAQKMESVGRLAGGVAHDFNNMLGVILGHAEMAMRDLPPDTPLHRSLQEIHTAAQYSAELTRQLLAFARKQIVTPQVLDLNETVAGMLKMLRRLIGEDIDLAWTPCRNLWATRIDPAQVDQILANLCVNARDAIAGVGKITIETANATVDESYRATHLEAVPGDYVVLIASDTGCGMDHDTVARLFEPFFTTKGLGKGTGLGLATVYGAVTQNNGFINVYSEPGQGTTFRVYLPRHEGDVAPAAQEPIEEPPASGSETVLVVEDEPTLLELTSTMLGLLGYRVLAAPTPAIAIELAETYGEPVHLLMTDVVMPEMNGRELSSRLLALYPELKVLYMSGYTANVIAHHGVLDDGVHFLQKPFSMKELAAAIRAALMYL